jgi:integrase
MSKPFKRKDSPYWWYAFSINGVRYRGSTETSNRKAAEEYIAKLRASEYEHVKLGKKQDLLLRYALGKYWKEHAQDKASAKSIKGYIERFSKVWGLDCFVSDINDARLNKLVNKLKADGCAPATINNHIRCFRSFHRLCGKWKLNTSEIDYSLHMQEQPDNRTRYLKDYEADSLFEQLAPHLKPVVLFALLTGIRKANIVNLQWKHVDLVGRKIILKVKSKKPGGKSHMVDISSILYEMLTELLDRHRKANKGHIDYEQHVFLYKGRKLSKDNRTGFKAALERAGISDFKFHDLRHTSFSWLVQQGKHLGLVKEIAGHADLKTTLKYAHHAPEQKLEAMEDTFLTRLSHVKNIS